MAKLRLRLDQVPGALGYRRFKRIIFGFRSPLQDSCCRLERDRSVQCLTGSGCGPCRKGGRSRVDGIRGCHVRSTRQSRCPHALATSSKSAVTKPNHAPDIAWARTLTASAPQGAYITSMLRRFDPRHGQDPPPQRSSVGAPEEITRLVRARVRQYYCNSLVERFTVQIARKATKSLQRFE